MANVWPYNTARWQRIRREKLRRSPLCEYCPEGRKRSATQVDHKKAIADGGDPWAWNNLASACQACHSQKTAHGEVLHGCDENGFPRDPGHEWNQGRVIQ